MARISPVLGSSATAAPPRPPPPPAGERTLHRDRQRGVEAKGQARAVLGGLALGLGDLETAAVHHHAPIAVAAHELAVVSRLDAVLTDERALGEAPVLLQPQLSLRDLADMPEGVGGGLRQRGR